MRGLFFHDRNQPLQLREIKKPKPVKDQVLIRLHSAALNHRDLWIWREQGTPSQEGIILGSDGAGVIHAVGEDADPLLLGMEVVINPSIGWGNNPIVQADSFRILGFPDHGTFSDYLVISKNQVFKKPEHLTFDEAAAMPLAALTAYRALFTRARLRQGEKVLITGIGAGTALWALQFAVQYKARVFVTSGSEEKIAKAISMGALGGFNYKEDQWINKASKEAGAFDVVIDSAAGHSFSKLPEIMAPGGRIIIFGRTAGDIPVLSPRILYWKQLSILGSTMGTRDEFLSMLDFVEGRKIKPCIDKVFPLTNYEEAVARMESGKQFGKIVFNISQSPS